MEGISAPQAVRGKHDTGQFLEALEKCREDLKANPDLAKQYDEELPVFIEALSGQREYVRRPPGRKLAQAAMAISSYRVRHIRHRGWSCGTYRSRVKMRFERWISAAFSEEELEALIRCCCEGRTLTHRQRDILQVLFHNTPKTLIHPYAISWLNEETADNRETE